MRPVVTVLIASLALALAPAATGSVPEPSPTARLGDLSAPTGPPARAIGIIATARDTVSPEVVARIEDVVGRDVVGQTELGGMTVAVRFNRTLPFEAVDAMKTRLSALPEISDVAPDLVVTPDSVPDDPYFERQINLHATTGTTEAATSPAYGIDAPMLWDATTGRKNVVVAVLDGGIVKHSDLTGQTVAGYDFVSQSKYAGDGNGRDSNPADPGNYSDGTYCPKQDSSWHGTHVAGTIGALRNNARGVAGIAPGVAMQPVRVVGRCVTTMSDVIAGIRWASGGRVSGVSTNKTPAKILNLSLSSTVDDFTCPTAYQEVIDEARSRGVVVVVSAGNQSLSVLTRTPSNCAGVLSVGAVAPDGSPTTYTNVGRTLGMVAPGGVDPRFQPDLGIWSTIDSGTKGPRGSTYGQMSGTSMAAATVSGAAALIHSLGDFTADQVIDVLKTSALRPPKIDDYYTCLSDDPNTGAERNVCGAGILNLAGIPAPTSTPTVDGGIAVGSTLTMTPGTWNGSPTEVRHEWLRDGVPIAGESAETYVVTADDVGHALSVRSTASKAGYPDFTSVSPELDLSMNAPGDLPDIGSLSVDPTTFVNGQSVRIIANFPDGVFMITLYEETSPGIWAAVGTAQSSSSGNASFSGYRVDGVRKLYARITSGTKVGRTEVDTLTPQVIAPTGSDTGNLSVDPSTFSVGESVRVAANFPDGSVLVTLYRETSPGVWTAVATDQSNSSGNAYFDGYQVDGTQNLFARKPNGDRTEVDTLTPAP